MFFLGTEASLKEYRIQILQFELVYSKLTKNNQYCEIRNKQIPKLTYIIHF